VLALREAIGDAGLVATGSAFESSRLKEIVRELPHFEAENPEIVAWIDDVVSHRVVDLHAWAKHDYYHPEMRGRTSIKVVLDALWKNDRLCATSSRLGRGCQPQSYKIRIGRCLPL
jgi:hypothetical protein